MKYRSFGEKNISLLGYGAMRFPIVEVDGTKTVDMERTEKLIDRAMEAGINYYDTGWPYHGGNSERIIGKLLSKYPRDSYYLADKYPGHQIMETYYPAEIFEAQLKKCGVDYFDFYLLHNVCDSSYDVYLDPKWGIIDYFLEEKRRGRIKHLGFSTHASVEKLSDFLEAVGDKMEFCQIQHNYLDHSLQRAEEKCALLKKYSLPIIIMEPVRGGKLANLHESADARLKAQRPDESTASWCFRFLENIPEVLTILSGMSNEEQLEDNIKTLSGGKPLDTAETELLYDIAEGLKASVPCTACKYCVDGCPAGLDIPTLLSVYNELKFSNNVNSSMRVEFMPEDKKPTAFIGCGKCTEICPQKIDIPKTLSTLADMLTTAPSWRKICIERDEEQKRNNSL